MPQDGFLFDVSVRENITYGRSGTTDDQADAALVELGLDRWADGLSDGRETRVGPRGEYLSVGERQLVRATGRCLVVDECRQHHAGPSPLILAALCEDPEFRGFALRRVAAADSYVPLAAAANLVLVQEPEIEAAAVEMCEQEVAR